ncbi:MAG: rhomboid family intramembrane serine protease [Acidobacteria bacterium]|nr:rhomboid family intramembrane serine protease [Acidobacteriota bacterium]
MSLRYEKNDESSPPPQLPTPEEFLKQQKDTIRRRSFWFLAGGALLLAYIVFELLAGRASARDLFGAIFFILGLFGLGGGAWGVYYARRLTLPDLIPSPEAFEFLQAARADGTKPYFTYIIIGCLILVTVFELLTERVASVFDVGEQSAAVAGLVKPLVVHRGEYWRILTAATLHGIFPLHLYFNAQALYGFGNLIERLSNRAHLTIVFLLSIVGGGFLSLFSMPDVRSIGASGGVMGLIGYAAVYGYRRRRQLPPDFLKTMLVNIAFIAAFGIIAYKIVDNFAHLGGLLTGALYGFFQIPRDLHKNPRFVKRKTEVFGLIALGVFIFTSILTVLLLLKIVRF